MEPIASCSSADMQRIREAVAVLSRPQPRQEYVRPLQSKWQVAQQQKRKPRPLGEVLGEFQGKVINAAKNLQTEPFGSAEQPASTGPSTDSGASGRVEQPAAASLFSNMTRDDPVQTAFQRANLISESAAGDLSLIHISEPTRPY